MNKYYLDKFRKLLKDDGIDAAIICPSEELKFLYGFTPTMCERFQAMFVKADGGEFYFANLLYTSEVKHGIPDVKVYSWFDGDFMTELLNKALEAEGLAGATMGVNSTAQSFNVIDIAERCHVKIKNAKPILEEARIIKNADELECLRQAAVLADKTYETVIKFIKPGMKEGDVADFIKTHMAEQGGTAPSCSCATGPNSSYPHNRGDLRVIEKQDIVRLDFGCAYKGLRSDTSRTVFVGSITDEQKKIYEIVRASNEAGEAAAVEGAYIPDVDKAARDVIESAGYGEYFPYRLGHGIGFMTHEAPDIKCSNERNLEKGMCFSVEPGIYLPGKFGMRIEDIVAITENGTEVLNKTTHDIIIIN